MGYRLAETVISTQAAKRTAKKRLRRINIDIDPTCDPTHGAQQMTFFNGFYRTWCYLPLVVTISFDGEGRKYSVAVLLRFSPKATCCNAAQLVWCYISYAGHSRNQTQN
jgi:hypothetical protein